MIAIVADSSTRDYQIRPGLLQTFPNEGFANAGKAINPNGWNAVAAPLLKGFGVGLAATAAAKIAEAAVDLENENFGDCGCGK